MDSVVFRARTSLSWQVWGMGLSTFEGWKLLLSCCWPRWSQLDCEITVWGVWRGQMWWCKTVWGVWHGQMWCKAVWGVWRGQMWCKTVWGVWHCEDGNRHKSDEDVWVDTYKRRWRRKHSRGLGRPGRTLVSLLPMVLCRGWEVSGTTWIFLSCGDWGLGRFFSWRNLGETGKWSHASCNQWRFPQMWCNTRLITISLPIEKTKNQYSSVPALRNKFVQCFDSFQERWPCSLMSYCAFTAVPTKQLWIRLPLEECSRRLGSSWLRSLSNQQQVMYRPGDGPWGY